MVRRRKMASRTTQRKALEVFQKVYVQPWAREKQTPRKQGIQRLRVSRRGEMFGDMPYGEVRKGKCQLLDKEQQGRSDTIQATHLVPEILFRSTAKRLSHNEGCQNEHRNTVYHRHFISLWSLLRISYKKAGKMSLEIQSTIDTIFLCGAFCLVGLP